MVGLGWFMAQSRFGVVFGLVSCLGLRFGLALVGVGFGWFRVLLFGLGLSQGRFSCGFAV